MLTRSQKGGHIGDAPWFPEDCLYHFRLIRFLRSFVIRARPKRSCGGDFPLCANSMAGRQHDTPGRMSWAFGDRSAGTPVGPFVIVCTGHGDTACTGRRPLVHTMLLAQSEKSQGFGGWPPRATEVRKNRMSLISFVALCEISALEPQISPIDADSGRNRTTEIQGPPRYKPLNTLELYVFSVLQSLHILFSWQGSLPQGKNKRR